MGAWLRRKVGGESEGGAAGDEKVVSGFAKCQEIYRK